MKADHDLGLCEPHDQTRAYVTSPSTVVRDCDVGRWRLDGNEVTRTCRDMSTTIGADNMSAFDVYEHEPSAH
jgi:hypothetical protein